jgi:leucyl aminopeptidase (aminopeptidase T)
MNPESRLERYAELVVGLGANVQPGQEVFIVPSIEHTELAAPSRAPRTRPAPRTST